MPGDHGGHSTLILHLAIISRLRRTTCQVATILAPMSILAMVGKLANATLAACIGWRQAITLFPALQTAMVTCVDSTWHPWLYDVIGALFGVGMDAPMRI